MQSRESDSQSNHKHITNFKQKLSNWSAQELVWSKSI